MTYILILITKIYEEEVIHAFFYFHFIKTIREKIINLKLSKNKLNKKVYDLIKNIEIISFIKEENIDKYIKFIKDKFNSNNNNIQLLNDLKGIYLFYQKRRF